jgi:hypothetical protein
MAATTAQTADGLNVRAAPFPSTYGEAFKQWWRGSKTRSAASEKSLVETGLEGTDLAFTDDGSGGATFRDVDLGGGKERYVHMLELGKGVRSDDEMPIGKRTSLLFGWLRLIRTVVTDQSF